MEHTSGVDAPATELKRPAAHDVQPVAPVVSPLYVPTAHAVQPLVPEATELYAPAAQAVQAADELAAATVL